MSRAGRRKESEAVKHCTFYVVYIMLALCWTTRDRNFVIGTGTEQSSLIKIRSYTTCCCHPQPPETGYRPVYNSFTINHRLLIFNWRHWGLECSYLDDVFLTNNKHFQLEKRCLWVSHDHWLRCHHTASSDQVSSTIRKASFDHIRYRMFSQRSLHWWTYHPNERC